MALALLAGAAFLIVSLTAGRADAQVAASPSWDFESGELSGWTVVSGDLAQQPTTGRAGVMYMRHGDYFIGTAETNAGSGSSDFNDALTGVIRSPTFTINDDYLTFLVGGGNDTTDRYVALVRQSDGTVLFSATGQDFERMRYVTWDLSSHQNTQAYIEIVDNATGHWGHINADRFRLSDAIPMDVNVSLLSTQVGFQPEAEKRVFLRSIQHTPPINPTGKTFEVVDTSNDGVVHTGTVTRWDSGASRWGSYFWIADFSTLTTSGTYFLRVLDSNGDMVSSDFGIGDTVLIDESLVLVGIQQLVDRVQDQWFSSEAVDPDGKRWGWPDSGSNIRELSSHTAVVHGLADVYDNVYDELSPADRVRLITQLKRGADYIVFSQDTSDADPELNYRFDHDKAGYVGGSGCGASNCVDYFTSRYRMYHDWAYAVTGLLRAHEVLETSDPTRANSYLAAATNSFAMMLSRPYHLDSEFAARPGQTNSASGCGGGSVSSADYVDCLARVMYNKESGWTIPNTLRVREKLPLLWAATQLYRETNNAEYKDAAILLADSIAERQFLDHENPIEEAYGNFYEFEGDDGAFLLEFAQNHRWHMSNVEPTTLQGFLDLIALFPSHPNVARWKNVVHTYGENYLKPSSRATPFGVHPLTAYYGSDVEGLKFFERTLHGASAMYGGIAKTQLQIGDYLNDNAYQDLASNNLQFLVGLNPGVPRGPNASVWVPLSFATGVGEQYFPGGGIVSHSVGGIGGQNPTHSPLGSISNGFAAHGQFNWNSRVSANSDRPVGFFKNSGALQFNESYIPHSHMYLSGLAYLENEFSLTVNTLNNGADVNATVSITLPSSHTYSTGSDGTVTITDLPLQRSGTVSVTYNNKTITRNIDTLASGSVVWNVDFDTYVDAVVTVPATLGRNATGTGTVRITNQGFSNTTAAVELSADGAFIGSAGSITGSLTVPVNSGQTATRSFTLVAGPKVAPMLVNARVTAGNNIVEAVGRGKVTTAETSDSPPIELVGWTVNQGIWGSADPKRLEAISTPIDAIGLYDTSGTDFSYGGDLTIESKGPNQAHAAAALVFRSGDDPQNGSYVVNVSTEGYVKLFRFPYHELAVHNVAITIGQTYKLRVDANGSSIKVYFADQTTPVIDVTDTTYTQGRFGLLSWQGRSSFTNMEVRLPGQMAVHPVAGDTSRLAVSWDAAADATSYRVQWKLVGAGDYPDANTETVTGTSHNIANLAADTTYTVRLTVIDSDPDPDVVLASGEATGTTLEEVTGVTVLAAPGKTDELDVSWTDIERDVGYVVHWKRSGDSTTYTTANSATVAADGTSYRILSLEADTAYDVRVTARVTIAGDTTDGGSAEAQGTTWVGEPQECVCVRLDNSWMVLIRSVIDY